jgi:hypothetical protein
MSVVFRSEKKERNWTSNDNARGSSVLGRHAEIPTTQETAYSYDTVSAIRNTKKGKHVRLKKEGEKIKREKEKEKEKEKERQQDFKIKREHEPIPWPTCHLYNYY